MTSIDGGMPGRRHTAAAGTRGSAPIMSEGNNQPQGVASAGRRALISSAMDGLNRFKQSWISVMLLKAGIGLGQVAALITLLILSGNLPSPLDRTRYQTQPSPQCPHPLYFCAWISIQIVRLITCWAVSCWILMRAERARRARGRRDSVEGGRGEEARGLGDGAMGLRTGSRTRGDEEVQPELLDSTTTTPSSECPPVLAFDAVTIAPCVTPPSSVGRKSEAKRDAVIESDLVEGGLTRHQYGSSAILLDNRNDETGTGIESKEKGIPDEPQLARLPMVSQRSNQSLRGARRMAQQRLRPGAPIPASPAGSVAGDAEADEAIGACEGEISHRGWRDRTAATFDRYALKISSCLGIISLILFILGNVLLFHPPPSSDTCYGASPLLWWGVMLVVAIGYILFAQVFFVVIVVGVGGAVVLDALRRVGVLPGPPAPEPPRPPQPEPLSPAQVEAIPVMSYVPDPSTFDVTLSTPIMDKDHRSIHLNTDPLETHGREEAVSALCDVSRLPYPPIYLPLHSSQSTCVICQEGYVAPKEERAILLRVDRLKRLSCGHVYHMDCIDEWLLKGSANCPACNSPVIIDCSARYDAARSGEARSRRGSTRLMSVSAQAPEGGDERRRSSVMSALRRVART